jgi:type II secretory pathway pseudopilin PulG
MKQLVMSQRGITLIELLVVAAIVMVGFAVAIPVTRSMVTNASGDSQVVATAAFLEAVRNRAVAERRNMRLTITAGTNSILVQRQEVPSNLLTTVDQFTLENSARFVRIISTLPDTPDAFGGGGDVNWGAAVPPIMFTSDGSLIDSAGDPQNGTIYIARPGFPETQRAVTVFGVTGLLRAWKWRGTQWQQ